MTNAYIELRERATLNINSRRRGADNRTCIRLLKLMRIAGLKPELNTGDTRERMGLTLRRIQLGLEEQAAGREFTKQEERADREIQSLIQADEI